MTDEYAVVGKGLVLIELVKNEEFSSVTKLVNSMEPKEAREVCISLAAHVVNLQRSVNALL